MFIFAFAIVQNNLNFGIMIDSSVIYDTVIKKSSISFSDKEILILNRLVLAELSSISFDSADTSDCEYLDILSSLNFRFSLALTHD